MTRNQHLAALGYAWRRHKDNPSGTVHLTKNGVATCGAKVDVRNSTPFLGGWGRLCKRCVRISGGADE
jgi:hypothetical protein